ncbi:MAG: ABC transporter permease [Dorea sp.]|jgi:ABC-2 type transport system permease protein|nr:ABC transporter permease [Dorea sp.]
MKQFGKILKFELKYYFKNKVFVGVTIFLVLLISVLMFLPRIVDVFSGNESKDTVAEEGGESPVLLVKAASPEEAETVKGLFETAFSGYDVQITEDSEWDIQEEILSESAECAFVFKNLTSYTYYVDNLSMYDSNTDIADSVLQNLYRMNKMIESGMSEEQAGEIIAVQIENNSVSLGKDQMQNYWYTYIMIFALYMVILLYGQMIATNVATEKSSRAMELLITSAKPVSMMFGKVIASCLAGFVQLIAVFGSAILFYTINKEQWADNMIVQSIFDMPVSLLAYMLIFFVLGFFIYAFLYGAIGSTASKLEDINTSVMPITMLFIIAFMVVMFSLASGNVDNALMKVCSYVPFTSSMAMFTRIAMSTVPWYEILISVAILIGSVAGIGVISAKIYRVGVLLYGTTPKIGSILKAVWRA